jgi:hypothetical protein
MNAVAHELEPTSSNLTAVPPRPVDDAGAVDAKCARAEGAVFRDGVIGAALGVLILAPTWALLVVLALRNSGTALWPAALMAAGVGVIAGVFMGGWAGTLVGSRSLEHFEHEILPPPPDEAFRKIVTMRP